MFHNILCPIDFTTFSHTALEHAVGIAHAHGASVTGLHVVPAGAAHDPNLPKWTTEDLRRLEAQVLKVLREADAPSPRAIAVVGDPALEIEKLASALPADVIVMPRHGWTGLMTHASGSVTEHVMCHARAPIIVVPESAKRLAPTSEMHRIVCGIDFSPASLKALRYAGDLASADHRQLIVTHVDPNGPSTLWRGRLHTVTANDIPPGVAVQERVQVGNPASEILRLAREDGADLIAIGGHRGHPPGCVMSGVVAGASCPILIVRAGPRLA